MPLLHRIFFKVSELEADRLSGFLSQNTSHGWEEKLLPDGYILATVHLHQEDIARSLVDKFSLIFPDGECQKDEVEEENWAESWKEFFTPVQGGKHFYVLAPWMTEEKATTKLIPVLIEPKTAFGTGHHGSTALCLDMISKLFEDEKINSQTKFLDLGTGSGILGIASCKLGLTGHGLDNDPIAIDNALTNRELNQIPPDMFSLNVGCEEDAKGPYDLIIANILAEPLIQMSSKLISLLKNGGHLILSGILVSQADKVEETYRAKGLPKAQRKESGEWASLCFKKE